MTPDSIKDPNYSFYKYDKDGNKLVYLGDNRWVRKDELPSLIDQEKYISRYKRPKIYAFEVIINILKPFIFATLIDCVIYLLIKNTDFLFYLYLDLSFIGIYILFNLGNIAIFFVKLYQKFASLNTRGRCNYTPTCSTYMILAIKKYGFFIGVIKGLTRIHRCDGTDKIDYP